MRESPVLSAMSSDTAEMAAVPSPAAVAGAEAVLPRAPAPTPLPGASRWRPPARAHPAPPRSRRGLAAAAAAAVADLLRLSAAQAQALRDATSLTISSRALVWIAGAGTVLLLGFGPVRSAYHPPGLTGGFGSVGDVLAAPAARWDAAWYLTIAHYGYLPELGPFTAARAAFFPLYPLLVWTVSLVGIAGVLAGVLVSIAALLAALYALHRLTTLELETGRLRPAIARATRTVSDREIARLALALTAFGPMAFFLSADYSESLYLALSIGVFLQARRGRWMWAGALGGLAAATRSTGALLLLPAATLYLYGPRTDRDERSPSAGDVPAEPLRGARLGGAHLGGAHASAARLRSARLRGVSVARLHAPRASVARLRRMLRPRYDLRADALWLTLIPAGLLAFILWYWLAGGEPLEPFHAQALWGRRFAGPFVATWDAARAAFDGLRQILSGQGRHLYFPLEGRSPFIEAGHNLLLFGFLALAVPATVGVTRRLPSAYGLYVVAALALPLSYPVPTQPLMSIPRFLLVLFPLYMWLAIELAARRRLRIGALAISAAALAFFTAQFATWHWIA
jgi:Mannosyltransferase (PIG-V)